MESYMNITISVKKWTNEKKLDKYAFHNIVHVFVRVDGSVVVCLFSIFVCCSSGSFQVFVLLRFLSILLLFSMFCCSGLFSVFFFVFGCFVSVFVLVLRCFSGRK